MDDQRRRSLARAFVGFLPIEDRRRNPTYWSICRAIASRQWLLDLADAVPPPQFAPNVLLAAVHDVLLSGAPHELAMHYRSVARHRGLVPRPRSDLAVADLFEDFCRRHHDEVEERCRTRVTQTNEVGRSSVLRAVLGTLGTDAPLALVDLGCSAGLNLFVDAYAVEYGDRRVGPPGASPLLHCELDGPPPPDELAEVVARVGLDRRPVDVTDEGAARWLLACLWPDDLERFGRLESAMRLARSRRDEVELLAGDMVGGLAGAVERCPGDARVVVTTTWAAAYLTTDERGALASEVARVAARRELVWVVMEYPRVARELGVLPEDATRRHRGASVVCRTRYRRGRPEPALVAECHAHGRWMSWR